MSLQLDRIERKGTDLKKSYDNKLNDSQGIVQEPQRHYKTFDYTTGLDLIRTVRWSDNSHPPMG